MHVRHALVKGSLMHLPDPLHKAINHLIMDPLNPLCEPTDCLTKWI